MTSAFPPRADMRERGWQVRFVPRTDKRQAEGSRRRLHLTDRGTEPPREKMSEADQSPRSIATACGPAGANLNIEWKSNSADGREGPMPTIDPPHVVCGSARKRHRDVTGCR